MLNNKYPTATADFLQIGMASTYLEEYAIAITTYQQPSIGTSEPIISTSMWFIFWRMGIGCRTLLASWSLADFMVWHL